MPRENPFSIGNMLNRYLRRPAHELAAVARVAGPLIALRYACAIVRTIPAIVRAGTLIPADDRMIQSLDSICVRTCGVQLTYPGRYFSAMREMYARNVYLRQPGFSIRPGDVVVDLGCNEGLFSVLAAKLGARVIAVDVQGGFEVPLREHLARNGCAGSVSFVHAQVGSETGLYANVSGGSHYTTVPPRRTMNDILAGIDHVRLMKIDIEGSEFALFSHPCDDWVQKVDMFTMEIHPEFGSCSALARFFAECGYPVKLHAEGYIYAWRGTSTA